jgi:hypothetical protein
VGMDGRHVAVQADGEGTMPITSRESP